MKTKITVKPYGKDLSRGGCFVLSENSHEVGRGHAQFVQKDEMWPMSGLWKAGTVVIDTIEIDPKRRKMGYGTRLLKEMESVAKTQGMKMICSTSTMSESESWWKKQGFRDTGRKRIWCKTITRK